MATKKTTTTKTSNDETTKAKKSSDFPKAYMQFRTILDGLEITAMRYCLKDKNAAKRIARAEELERVLKPIITEYQNKLRMGEVDCPDGYFDCGGCCLAYPCPD